jgi:2,3-bisphosphoglycerate-independent phosphoglycerate mutase
LIDATQQHGLQKFLSTPSTDGRDVDPKSGKHYIQDLQDYIANTTVKLASIVGRYYAMDRDSWERVKLAYDLLVNGIGTHTTNAVASIEESYEVNVTDEFIHPTVVVDEYDQPLAQLKKMMWLFSLISEPIEDEN